MRNLSVGLFFHPDCRVEIRGPGKVRIGKRVRCIENGFEHLTIVTTNPQARVDIGDEVLLGGVKIICSDRIEIGSNCLIAPSVFMDSDFPNDPTSPTTPIRVGDHCWLAGRTGVLGGASIGSGSLLGFGAVVTQRTVSDNFLVAGNPGRPILKLTT